jgi:hypothetical protein
MTTAREHLIALEERPRRIAAAISAGAARHDRRWRPRLIAFTRRTEQLYAAEIDRFFDRYRSDLALRPYTDPLLEEVRDYLYWLRWVSWNATNLLALSDEDEDDELAVDFCRHVLAYAALRFVDDGLDGHRTYKDARQTLVAFIEQKRVPAALRPEAYSVFLGMCVFNFARQRIEERSPTGSASIARLLDRASVGVLAEASAQTITDEKAYEQIARRKAGAYNLILYVPFFRTLDPGEHQPLRAVLVEMDVLAQLINDMRDDVDDQQRQQPTAVAVYDRDRLAAELTRRVEALWTSAASFPPDQRDALAAMFVNLDLEVFADHTRQMP